MKRHVLVALDHNKVVDSAVVAKVLIVRKVVALRHVLVSVAQADPDNVQELVAHSVKAARRRRVTRVRKRYVKRLTIWRRRQSVARSSQEAMEILQFDFAAALH